jgi:endonuclease I
MIYSIEFSKDADKTLKKWKKLNSLFPRHCERSEAIQTIQWIAALRSQ